MSANTATVQTRAEEAGEAHALAFRLAFAAAVGLTLGEVFGWDFPFLPAMLAVQLLAGPGGISVKQGIGFVVVMAAACIFAVLVAQILVDSPLVLLLVVALVIFLAFLLLARGQAMGVAATFLITTAVVPLLAIESMSVAYGLIHSLIAGSVLAVLLAFAANALFPSKMHAEPGVFHQPHAGNPVAIALANAAALMSVVIYFMLTVSPVSIVTVLTVIGILRQPASVGGGAGLGPCRGPRRDRRLSSRHASSFPRLSSAGRPVGRAYVRGAYLARWRVGTDLHGRPHHLPHLARAWTLALASGQRLPLRCPRFRRHGGGGLRHRHGERPARSVWRPPTEAWCFNPLTLCQSGTPRLDRSGGRLTP